MPLPRVPYVVGYVTHFSVMIPTAREGSNHRITSDRTPHELLASSGTGRMHGSTGVQLRICAVDPSGSRDVTRVYWCIGRTVSAQHEHSTLLISSRCLARRSHTHTNLRAAYRYRRVSRYGDYHYY